MRHKFILAALPTKPTQIPTLQPRQFTVGNQNNNQSWETEFSPETESLISVMLLSQDKYLLFRKDRMPLNASSLISFFKLILLLGSSDF